ncbi:protein translocase subunit SecD [bacterium]|nr:protein translocase subunit SecD [bacterium]
MRGAQVWRMVVTVVIVILSLYFLYPTLRLNLLTEENKLERPDIEENLSSKSIKLGLDLQGGMHLLMEPDMVSLLSAKATKRDGNFIGALRETERLSDNQNKDFIEVLPSVFKREKLDIVEYFPNLGGSDNEVLTAIYQEREKAVDGALEVIRSRIDQFGVAEPIIQKAGNDRIIVELPGIQDAERARSLLKETAILQFQLVRREKDVIQTVEKVDAVLAADPQLLTMAYRAENEEELEAMEATEETSEQADMTVSEDKTEPEPVVEEAPSMDELIASEEVVEEEVVSTSDLFEADSTSPIPDELPFGEEAAASEISRPFSAHVEVMGDVIMVPRSEYEIVNRIIQIPSVIDALPHGSVLVWAAKDEVVRGIQYRALYLLSDKIEIAGDRIEKANFGFGSGTDPRAAGKPVVNLGFDAQGSRIFAQVTGSNIGRRLAIVLNERVYSAPNIRSKITGDAQISGITELDEAKMISIVLRAGSLPVPLNIKSERTVGPSLGEDSIRKGVMATVVGAILVALFMIMYYKMSGVIADIALILNLVALMAGMAAFRATLTLPGIAGIILTIGMAVDANVLIFERIREELKSGKTVRTAIDTGYSRAFKTIVDANLTTLITAAILYNFGTGAVKGFAVTLFMGIIISMITAIVVTRLIFEFITSKRHIEKLSI